jgi:hypothetical protein
MYDGLSRLPLEESARRKLEAVHRLNLLGVDIVI